MKIVQINACDNGSTGKILLDIFDGIGKENERIAFVSRKYSSRDEVIKMHSRLQYRIHKFLSSYLGLDEFGSYFSTKKTINQLKKIKPDILHLHNLHDHTINYVLLFRYIKKYNVKTIWTMHDCWAFTGGCFYFELNGCEKWKTGCSHCKYLKSTGMVANIDRTKRQYYLKKKSFLNVKNMLIVTPSEWLKNHVKNSFLKEYEVKVILNGINLDNFSRTDRHTFDNIIDRHKKVLLGVAAPFNERKGFSDFIKLADMLQPEFQLVMVGLNDEQLATLPSKIVGIKRTNNQKELAELYSMAYAFLNLTYEDTSSTVNVEALACGTPVICYKSGGATEMLDSGNSVVVEQGNLEGVLKALEKAEILNGARDDIERRAKKDFLSQRMADEYAMIYKEMNSRGN